MLNVNDIVWNDFESASALDLKAAGTIRYAIDASTRAIVLAYAIGDAPARAWHAGGAILDWNDAPDDLRDAFDRGATLAAWNASFDSAVWNYATLGFPFLLPERVIDPMIQAGVSNLPTDLQSASRYLNGAGKQADGKKLIKLFSAEGATPSEHPEEWERFLSYARQDVGAMRDVYRRTRPLPLAEWQQYWSFEHINRRGVAIDLPFVLRAAALAAEDAIAIGRRLDELTEGAVTRVTQAKRIASWLCDQLPDAAMRQALVCGGADENDDVDEDEAESPELSLKRERVERLLAMLDVKRANGGLCNSEAIAREVATLRLYGAGAAPKKFARLAAQQVDGVLRDQYRFSGAGQTGRMCVDAETLLDTPTGPRRIVDLRPGDFVLTHRRRPRPVLARIHKGREPMVRLDGPKGESIVATLDHRLLTRRGWKKIDECFIKGATGSFALRDGYEPLSFITPNNVRDRARPRSEPSPGISSPETRTVAGGISSRKSTETPTGSSARSFTLRDGYEPLSFNARNDGNDWTRPRSRTSHDIRDLETRIASRGVSSSKSGSLLLQQDGPSQPAIWSALRGREDHAPRPLCEVEWHGLYLRASNDSCKIVGLGEFAEHGRCSPHRREQDKQSSRQSGDCYTRGPSTAASAPAWSLVYVGEREVWDVSVAGDASYLAQGLAHHNSGRGAQIQNLTRDVLGENGTHEAALVDAIAEGCSYAELAAASPIDVPVARKLALLVRPALVAAPGKVFVWSDWSAIEARITPWLAEGAEHVLDVFRANDADPTRFDIYTIAAADILHKHPSEITKAERNIGKVATLALGFGGSVKALQNMALNYRIHLEDAEARRIVESWREANPWAREFWGAHRDGESFGLWGAALSAWESPGQITTAGRIAFVYREDYLGGALFMGLPSGRLLTYPRPRWRDVDVLDKDGNPTGEKRSELSFRRARGRAKLWHGTFCENSVQGAAADILRQTVTRIENNPALAFMPIRLHTHDEIVVEVDEARADEARAALRREMLKLPDWASGLPLQSEESVCAYYTKAKAALTV
jgi:hypothetical protein